MKAGKNSILIQGLPFFCALAAIIPGMIGRASSLENGKIAIMTLLLTATASFYIRMYEETILNKRYAKLIILVSYLGAISLMLLIPQSHIFCFWILGGLFLAMTIDYKLGLLLHFTLSFILVIARSLKPEFVIQLLFLGILMCMLSGALISKATVIYAIIIILSTNVTISFIINNFIFYSKEDYNYLSSLFSILLVLTAAYYMTAFYHKKFPEHAELSVAATALEDNDKSTAPDPVLSSQEQTDMQSAGKIENSGTRMEGSSSKNITDNLYSQEGEEQKKAEEGPDMSASFPEEAEKEEEAREIKLESVTGAHSSYDILSSTENELLQRLKEYSLSLHAHAMQIADLSCRAAKEIGADEMLAMTGGLYHEIGKLNGKNYIEEGLLIAEDYAFPKELKAILKEHNIKYDKPSSIEAAIVMLSDNVVSTIEYIRKTDGYRFSANKIIDNIFQMRMEKGAFDRIDLSLKDFKRLKDFYLKEFEE
jgi:putative nucleotidyltransferase with HDIG domain